MFESSSKNTRSDCSSGEEETNVTILSGLGEYDRRVIPNTSLMMKEFGGGAEKCIRAI